MTYEIGQHVQVLMPDGWRDGRVHKVVRWYEGEVRYEIHGKGFVTITSARSMRAHTPAAEGE